MTGGASFLVVVITDLGTYTHLEYEVLQRPTMNGHIVILTGLPPGTPWQ